MQSAAHAIFIIKSYVTEAHRDMATEECKDCEPAAAVHPSSQTADAAVTLPRVVITFCTQCRWMLRAAYVSASFLTHGF